MSAETQVANERIVARFRKHWAMLVRDTIGTILLIFLPFILWIVIASSEFIPFVQPIPTAWIELLLALWFLVIWITLAVLWTNYYLDTWIITNKRIINIEQLSLFHRRAAVWNIDKVQNITTKTTGPIQSLLSYGSIEVHTAGRPGEGAKMDGIPHPDIVRAIILAQIEHVGELEETNKQKDELLRFVSHEVKGYLTKNKAAFAAIVEGDYGAVPQQLSKMAGLALNDTEKGVRTFMSILDDSEAPLKLEMENIDLKTSVTESIQRIQDPAEKKNLRLEINIGEGSYTVKGDKKKIEEHVLRNLFENALHYTPQGYIQVELHHIDNRIRLSVRDSGVGIVPDDMQHLFTKGGKGKDSSAINKESTGYGLYIAKSIVDAHGGTMWAESEGQGKGSIFYVEFPVA